MFGGPWKRLSYLLVAAICILNSCGTVVFNHEKHIFPEPEHNFDPPLKPETSATLASTEIKQRSTATLDSEKPKRVDGEASTSKYRQGVKENTTPAAAENLNRQLQSCPVACSSGEGWVCQTEDICSSCIVSETCSVLTEACPGDLYGGLDCNKEKSKTRSICPRACLRGLTRVCLETNLCSKCEEAQVCPLLTKRCPVGKYGGLNCNEKIPNTTSACPKACQKGFTKICSKANFCARCEESKVCRILTQRCPLGQYGGASCSAYKTFHSESCYKSLQGSSEGVSSLDWVNNLDFPNKPRFRWFRLRKAMEPIPGDVTLIAGVLYSFSEGTLKLSVLFPPLHPNESRMASIRVSSQETTRSEHCQITENIWHCLFRIDNLSTKSTYQYNVQYRPNERNANLVFEYRGSIPKQFGYPRVVTMSCFGSDDNMNKESLVEAVLKQSPDLVVLQGDQTYFHGNLGYGILETIYTINKITRDRPTIVQLDDHDYGQGNIFGALNQNPRSGVGFWAKPPCLVNYIQELSLSHNPDSVVDGSTLQNGITVHYSNYKYSGQIDFAILEVRKFKAVNKRIGSLLGVDQEKWLKDWCSNQDNALKIVLAQTPFAALSTHSSANGDLKHKGYIISNTGDNDPNGFPPSARNRTMGILQGCSPLVLSGDQHLGIAVRYDDYGIGECASPAAINDGFWRLTDKKVGLSHVDPFGHQYTLLAVWNVDRELSKNIFKPELTKRASSDVKAARADGFLVVDFGDGHATCRATSYRAGVSVKWEAKFQTNHTSV